MIHNRQETLLERCRSLGVLLETKHTGMHYYTAGKEHTDTFFQFTPGCADADFRRTVAEEQMDEIGRLGLMYEIGVILTPALGGVLLAGTLQHLFWGEKPLLVIAEKVGGVWCIRRGQKLPSNKGILILDDAYNKGTTFHALHALCDQYPEGGPIVAYCTIVDRSPQGFVHPTGAQMFPFISLIRYPAESYPPMLCPYEKQGVPLEKDGTLVDIYGKRIGTEKIDVDNTIL